jgi:hypothetical protein
MYPRFHATDRFDLLEINIPANSTANKFPIPDQPQLRSDADQCTIIQAIETYCIFDVPLSPNAVALPTDVQLQQTYLTLYILGEESIYRIPLINLRNVASVVNTGGAPIPFKFEMQKFKNKEVDWTKSYFSTPVNYGAVFATFSFLLGVHYMWLPPGTMANIRAVEEQQFCAVQPQPGFVSYKNK